MATRRRFERKPRDATRRAIRYDAMMDDTIDENAAWQAFARRDRAFDGRFVVAVRSTGIYCKPSCAARRPRRENVAFLDDAAAARAAGYRACRRCLPDSAARDRVAVTDAAAIIASGATAPALADIAARVGYAPHHFHRLFRRLTGVTPAAFARAVRVDRAMAALRDGSPVTAALYDAGYTTPSRFYADAARLGMAPAVRAQGGAGETIAWTVVPTALGDLSAAATARGWCRLAFERDDDMLRTAFRAATIVRGDAALHDRAAALVAVAEAVPHDAALPRPLRETALRALLWQAADARG